MTGSHSLEAKGCLARWAAELEGSSRALSVGGRAPDQRGRSTLPSLAGVGSDVGSLGDDVAADRKRQEGTRGAGGHTLHDRNVERADGELVAVRAVALRRTRTLVSGQAVVGQPRHGTRRERGTCFQTGD